MHGDRVAQAGYSVKQERLKVRIEAKQAKREKKARQKEVKTILTQMLEGKIILTQMLKGKTLVLIVFIP